MKKKLVYVTIAALLIVFAFGSIYMPKATKEWEPTTIKRDVISTTETTTTKELTEQSSSPKMIVNDNGTQIIEVETTTKEIVDESGTKKNSVTEKTTVYNVTGVKELVGREPIKIDEKLEVIDVLITIFYCLAIVCIGLFASRKKKGEVRNEDDYFLAGKSLPWWAIGSSLIAANISAEQFVGQSGSGFVIGLGIASYEWMAAITLIIVGKFFLPVFINKKIYTIPEFVEKRYNTTLKTILAVFWLGLYVFVNLATVMYLGALAMKNIAGLELIYGLLILALFATAYSLWGGLSAVAWTDVIQVVVLIAGGVITTIIALKAVTVENTVVAGAKELVTAVPEHFEMILSRENPEFSNLPGIGVLIGGMFVANLYYWGFNQYIIQRTFAAKSLKEAQKGIAFAAIIKIIIPFIVVIPGIACYYMVKEGLISSSELGFIAEGDKAGQIKSDAAYPTLINLLPTGVKGVAFAALIAAIVSSLASMLNSTATIFTMDIYKPYIEPKLKKPVSLVNVGRIVAAVSLVIAIPISFVMQNAGQVFQVIQEYTGLVSPGILAIFLLGLFYKKATTKGAIIGVLSSIPVAVLLKLPSLTGAEALKALSLPFMHQMGITTLITMGIVVLVSYIQNKNADDPKGIAVDSNFFKTDSVFNIIAYAVMLVLVALYVIFWNTDMVKMIFG